VDFVPFQVSSGPVNNRRKLTNPWLAKPWRISAWTLAIGLAAGLSLAAPGATAQCNPAIPAVDGAGAVPSNPIQAELQTTFVNSQLAKMPIRQPILIARNSQGMVRIDRTLGKFKLESGPAAGTEEERHSISICDPETKSWVVMDTLNKTATKSKSIAMQTGMKQESSGTFCADWSKIRKMPNTVVENLGHKQISGVDAEGWKFTTQAVTPPGAAEPRGPMVHEEWCSDEIAAIVLRVQYGRNNMRTEIALVNLQRFEPDPALFQIPPDYTVSERVNEKPLGMRLGALNAPVVTAPR
jgi:hypothetical protein